MPSSVGHADVHDDDVRLQLTSEPDGVGSVGGFADDLDVVLELEDEAEALADERLVVGEQDAVIGWLPSAVAVRGGRSRRPPPGRPRARRRGG